MGRAARLFGALPLLLTISKPCSERCGAWVKGEIDTDTRELIYRFLVPPGSEVFVQERETEVEGLRLVTFAPLASGSAVRCPSCIKALLLRLSEVSVDLRPDYAYSPRRPKGRPRGQGTAAVVPSA